MRTMTMTMAALAVAALLPVAAGAADAKALGRNDSSASTSFSATAAQAAESCIYSESKQTKDVMNGHAAWSCHNRVSARVYLHATTASGYWDHLLTNPSWFVCKIDNGQNHGGLHPRRWLDTKGDQYGNWGWVSDNDVSSDTEGIKTCS